MAELPDDVLAMLALEQHMFSPSGAEPFADYNKTAGPTSPAEFGAIVKKAMRDMMEQRPRRHGGPDYPHITWPGGHICGECGADVSALIEAQRERRDND